MLYFILMVQYLVIAVTEVHADNIHAGSTQVPNHLHTIRLWT